MERIARLTRSLLSIGEGRGREGFHDGRLRGEQGRALLWGNAHEAASEWLR